MVVLSCPLDSFYVPYSPLCQLVFPEEMIYVAHLIASCLGTLRLLRLCTLFDLDPFADLERAEVA